MPRARACARCCCCCPPVSRPLAAPPPPSLQGRHPAVLGVAQRRPGGRPGAAAGGGGPQSKGLRGAPRPSRAQPPLSHSVCVCVVVCVCAWVGGACLLTLGPIALPQGFTPLIAAAHRGHVEVVRALLKGGADTTHRDDMVRAQRARGLRGTAGGGERGGEGGSLASPRCSPAAFRAACRRVTGRSIARRRRVIRRSWRCSVSGCHCAWGG